MDYKKEIKEIFKEYCKDNEMKFTEKRFKDFLEFLEIDIYDWAKENLRCYFRNLEIKTEGTIGPKNSISFCEDLSI